jgi:hypothetical protein
MTVEKKHAGCHRVESRELAEIPVKVAAESV